MCTVTWSAGQTGYTLLFNRDEQLSRGPAFPPEERSRGGVRFICPLDPDGGGTWLGVNEYGLTVGILNYYSAEVSPEDHAGGRVSRGLLVLSLMDAPDLDEVARRLEGKQKEYYSPFLLFGAEVGGRRIAWRWDGREFRQDRDPALPLSTSGYEPEDVVRFRRELLERFRGDDGGVTVDTLRAYHSFHDPERPGYSVSMRREEAQTVSFAEITVDREEVSFSYTDGFPAQGTPLPTVGIPRRG